MWCRLLNRPQRVDERKPARYERSALRDPNEVTGGKWFVLASLISRAQAR